MNIQLIKTKSEELEEATNRFKNRQFDLEQKKNELDEIIAETRTRRRSFT